MGMLSTWDGFIEFQPPFSATILKGSPYESGGFEFSFITHRDDETVPDEGGWEIRKTRILVMGVKATSEHDFRGYNIPAQIQSLLDFLVSQGVTVECSGYIEKLAEDGERSRLYVRDGQVHEVMATISWPGWEV